MSWYNTSEHLPNQEEWVIGCGVLEDYEIIRFCILDENTDKEWRCWQTKDDYFLGLDTMPYWSFFEKLPEEWKRKRKQTESGPWSTYKYMWETLKSACETDSDFPVTGRNVLDHMNFMERTYGIQEDDEE
jgi:hypothetical protein